VGAAEPGRNTSVGSGKCSVRKDDLRLASTRERAEKWFAAAQIGVGGLSLAAFAFVDRLPGLVKSLARDDGALLAWDAVLSGAVLLPGVIAIGATFPLAVRILARDATDAAAASALGLLWFRS
jgi:hypothetical protein